MVLSWKPGKFADTHDIYLGADADAVNAAGRANPSGVLVSQGQDANTYDPAGPLELGKTYYWRVDEVNAPPSSTIAKGTVWSFTVEPIAYPVINITATASSAQATMGPEKTIDGSGLDASDQHSTVSTDMWLSNIAGPQPTWIQYEFDTIYKLHEMWVWNSNQAIEPTFGVGLKDVTIEVSTDGSNWTTIPGSAAVCPGVRTGGLHAQHHRQLRRRRGQVRPHHRRQQLGQPGQAVQSQRSAVLLRPRSGARAQARFRGRERRHQRRSDGRRQL